MDYFGAKQHLHADLQEMYIVLMVRPHFYLTMHIKRHIISSYIATI